MKNFFLTLSFAAFSTYAAAQGGTNSPYSMYGLGIMADQTSGYNRGMNGMGIGFREHNQVNIANPASYSALDSLTFIFDLGMSLQLTNFSENGKKKNVNSANFEYALGAFRAAKNVGVSFGILPLSNVGYKFSRTAGSADEGTMHTQTFSGSGGLHEIFLGAGWQPVTGLSVGANVNYVWGELDHQDAISFTDAYAKTLSKRRTSQINNILFDFGASYTARIGKKDWGTIGVTYRPGKSLHSNASCMVIDADPQTSVTDTTVLVNRDGYAVPEQIGIGLAYNHGEKWTVGIDYTLQKWSTTNYPVYSSVNKVASYDTKTGVFDDRHKFNVGGEYCKNKGGKMGRSFSDRVRYRFGMSYATPYLKINGSEGPKEVSLSAGVGLPIMNGWNNRSLLNVGVQWRNLSAKNMMSENTFVINVGITFNERWFAKWKFE